MTKEYAKRLTEIDCVLSYLPVEDLIKIPESIRIAIKENKDVEYNWEYDESKTLEDQNLNRDTIIFLSYLNTEYILNEGQKQLMLEIYNFNDRVLAKKRASKTVINSIINAEKEDSKKEDKMVVIYKDSFFSKLKRKIMNFFNFNKR